MRKAARAMAVGVSLAASIRTRVEAPAVAVHAATRRTPSTPPRRLYSVEEEVRS